MQQPEGDGSRKEELDANTFTDFLAETATMLEDHGKAFIFENPAATGRCPKVWDMPSIQKMMDKTGAIILPVDMCEYGLGPPDQKEARYRKYTWILVSRRLLPTARSLVRRCRGGHRHVLLEEFGVEL